MKTIDSLRDNIIDKLLTISNENYLSALNQLIDKGMNKADVVILNQQQIAVLQLSDQDILHGKLFDNTEVDKFDLQWLSDK